jgi:hypothetical protein
VLLEVQIGFLLYRIIIGESHFIFAKLKFSAYGMNTTAEFLLDLLARMRVPKIILKAKIRLLRSFLVLRDRIFSLTIIQNYELNEFRNSNARYCSTHSRL